MIGYIDLNCVKTTKIHSTLIRGSIITQAGKPVKNARLDFNNGLTAGTTDNYGNFSASVPVPAGEKMGLKIFVGDDMKFNEQITISSNTPLELMIE